MRTFTQLTFALLGLAVASAAGAASTTLTDDTFSNANWSVVDSASVSGPSAGQVGAGGNPGSYWGVQITGFNSPGYVVSNSSALTFDPPTSGFINTIGYSLDHQRFVPAPNPPNLPNPTESYWLAIRQGSCIYQALAGIAGQVVTGWRSATIFPIGASQFGIVSGGGCPINPDFSVTAPTLEFGVYTRFDGTSGAMSIGFDTLSLTISFQPEILSVSTNNLSHGFVLVGDTSTLPLTVTNTGATVSALTGTFPAVTAPQTPNSTLAFGPLSGGQNAARNYSFSPGARGTAVSVTNLTSNAGNEQVIFGGTGVAPVNSVDASQADAGPVRLGTSGLARVVVTNTGDGNLSGAGAASNLDGSATVLGGPLFAGPAPASALSLADGASANLDYTYTPDDRSADMAGITLAFTNGSDDEQNDAQNVNVQLDGTGVGPIYASLPTPGSTLDFGQVVSGQPVTLTLEIDNTSADNDGGDATLTDLTLDGFISGPDAGAWKLASTPRVVSRGGSTLLAIQLAPNVDTEQTVSATLTIETDEGTAFGDLTGSSFSYTLTGTALPQPVIPALNTWGLALLALLLATIGAPRLRRRAV